MKIYSIYILTFLLFISFNVFASNHKILKPQSSYKEEALLIIAPTKGSTSEDYEELAKHLQIYSNFALWVAIIDFTDQTPSAHKFTPAVKKIIEEVNNLKEGNFTNEQIYIAGHGYGGFAAYKHVAHSKFGGLILLGSYIPETKGTTKYILEKYPIPVITIGGEIDGIVSLPWMTREFLKFQILRGRNKTKATRKKPVVVIPGLNHYDFSNGAIVDGDIKSSMTQNSAYTNINNIINSFIVLNSPWAKSAPSIISQKENYISRQIDITENLLNGYTIAQSTDERLCQTAQRVSSGFGNHIWRSIKTTPYAHRRKSNFDNKKPLLIYKEPNSNLSIHYFINHPVNPEDRPGVTYSPSSVDCKMVNQNNIASIPGLEPDNFEKSCMDINQNSLDIAKSFLTYTQLRRFQATGKSVTLLDDIVTSSDDAWNGTDMTFHESSYYTLEIASVTFRTEVSDIYFPGVKYCKLLSVRRILEWLLVDALRD